MGRMCKEFLAFQKQVAMKQTRRYDSYYVGGLSEKDAAAYVAKIKGTTSRASKFYTVYGS